MAKKLGLEGFDAEGRRVLMRVDFNVPLDPDRNITDDTRIRAALPSLERILAGGGSVILMSHLGRPKGKIDPAASLRPVADRLADLVEAPVRFATDTVGPDATAKAAALQPGEILLLENLRFNPGETANDDGFARALAGLGDTYVNDAFGTAHRAHASTVGVTRHVDQARAGLLMEKELEHLGALLADPDRPFVAVLGGAKVAGKVEVILNLLDRVDTLLLGGGMIFTFFKVQGLGIGKSLLDVESLEVVREIQAKARSCRARLVLPEDCIVADEFAETAARREVLVTDIPELDGPGHRAAHDGPLRRAGGRGQGDLLERSHGRLRDALLRGRDPGRGRGGGRGHGPRRAQRGRRRRLGGGGQPAGPGRPHHPHLHRGRGLPGVHGRAGTAGRDRPDRRLRPRRGRFDRARQDVRFPVPHRSGLRRTGDPCDR